MKSYIKIVLLILLYTSVSAHPGETSSGDNGVYTYTQTIDSSSSSPYYTSYDTSSGFGVYAYYNKDYGWQHNFPDYNLSGMNILSATLVITAWDVDSEAKWGTQGEYDGISLDGVDLNPGLLQGSNDTISVTEFNLPLEGITDDGLLDMYIDIDMNHNYRYWATRLDKSVLSISYKFIQNNENPSQPELSSSIPAPSSINNLVILINGPSPADPDNDIVSYTYRWYVDVGQGFYVDDEFAGKINHTSNTVLASETSVFERWRVEVTPMDSKGAIGPAQVYTWPAITDDSDGDGVSDNEDDYPLDALRAYNSYYPAYNNFNTLLFEDRWPKKGDYDLNDLVVHFNFTFISDSSNKIKEIILISDLIASGAMIDNGFGIEIEGLLDTQIESASIEYEGFSDSISAEGGHTQSAVFIIANDVSEYMSGTNSFSFYNTEEGDNRQAQRLILKIVLVESVSIDISNAPFNPFIFPDNDRSKETHLINHAPTQLADSSYFGSFSDHTNIEEGRYYLTATGLPWALEIVGKVDHPKEKKDFAKAYPAVVEWAMENGSKNIDWYVYPVSTYIWSRN